MIKSYFILKEVDFTFEQTLSKGLMISGAWFSMFTSKHNVLIKIKAFGQGSSKTLPVLDSKQFAVSHF